MAASRRIKRAKITHLSLCPKGVNQMPVLYKADGSFELECISKMDDQGDLLALVYVPERPDAEGDVASAEVIKGFAHDFLRHGGHIDIVHDLKPVGVDRAHVAETFIVQKGDPRFTDWKDDAGKALDATGSWGTLIKIHDPELKRLYREGGWRGVSMYGQAHVEPVAKSSLPTTNTMTPEELKKALADALAAQNATLVESLSKALKAALPEAPAAPAPVAKAEPVAFEGDPSNLEDLAKHEEKVLLKSLDLSKPADIATWRAHLAKKAAGAPKTELEKAQAQLAKAQADLAKILGASNQPTGDAPPAEGQDNTGLSKAQADQFALGRKIAEAANKASGRK